MKSKGFKFRPKAKGLKEIKVESDMILDVRDRPKWKSWLMLSIQHVFAMFGATVLIPILINNHASGMEVISTDIALFASGVGTLIYILVTGAKVPIYLGSSAAYVATMGAMWPLYGNSMFLGLLGVGVIYLIVALFIYLFGTGWLKKLLPPVVVGPMIMIIGLSLAGIAVNNIFQEQAKLPIVDVHSAEWHIDWLGVLVAVITVASAMLISLLMKGKLKLMPILGAMIIGTAIALLISIGHHPKYGINNPWNKYEDINWTQLSTYLKVPDFSHSVFVGKVEPGNAHWSFMPFILMMPIAFATIAEHIGDHTVLGKITGRDYINGTPGVHRTLIGDGLATMFGGIVGGPANTSYGENTTTVGLSKVGSVYVTGLAAVFAIIMSFIGLVPTLLSLIPQYVIGGLEFILFGFIASNGLKVMVDDKVDMHNIRNVFVVSTMLLVGLGGAVIGWTMNETIVKFSGTSVAMVIGIIMNLLLPKDRGINPDKMPKIAEKKAPKKINKDVDITNRF